MYKFIIKIMLIFSLAMSPLAIARTVTIHNATHGYLMVTPLTKSAGECIQPRSYQCTLEFKNYLDNQITLHGVATDGRLFYDAKTNYFTLEGELAGFVHLKVVYGNKTIFITKAGRYHISKSFPKGNLTITYTSQIGNK